MQYRTDFIKFLGLIKESMHRVTFNHIERSNLIKVLEVLEIIDPAVSKVIEDTVQSMHSVMEDLIDV